MRRIVFGFMSTVSALVLLFSYHTSTSARSSTSTTSSGTGTSGGTTSGSSSGTSSSPDDSSSGSGSSSSSGSGSSDSSSSDSSSSGTYTGDAANTRWGVVQVQITVTNGKITKAEAVQYPTGNPRDQEINAYAVPQLNSETVQRQGGNIDAISGATVTSDGYIQSLQSAIDQANL
jgi:uncharacterized protein with FMN-binding domain